MLLKQNQLIKEQYLEDWPLHYYEITDIEDRESILEYVLQENPNSQEDKKRLAILKKRYPDLKSDMYMRAWLELKTHQNDGHGRLFFKDKQKEVQKSLALLGVYDERDSVLVAEWREFAKYKITFDSMNKSYRTAILGFGDVGEKNAGLRIAHEIRTVLKDIPSKYGFSKETEELYQIFEETFKSMMKDGERLWLRASIH